MDNVVTWQGASNKPVFGRCDFQIIAGSSEFRRGDANGDGKVDLSDAVLVLGCKFLGEACPQCRDAADANDDGAVDISDPIALLGFLFLGSAVLSVPGPGACGPDPTADDSLPDCFYENCS